MQLTGNGELVASNFDQYDLIVSFGHGTVRPTLLIRIISNMSNENVEMNLNQACQVGMALGATQSVVYHFSVDDNESTSTSGSSNDIIHIRHNRAWTRAKIGSGPWEKIVQ